MDELSEQAKKAKVLVAQPNYTNSFSSEVHVNHLECTVEWTRAGMWPMVQEAYERGLADAHIPEAEREDLDVEQQLLYNFQIVGRTFVHFARTQMADVAVKGGYSHILWFDDDALISPEYLPKMIDHDVDVVIAPYPMRRPAYEIGVLRSTAYRCNACEWYGYLLWDYETEKVVVLDTMPDPEGMEEETGPVACPPNDDEVFCPSCNSKDLWRDFHNHKAYRNLSALHNLDQGMMSVDGGGTHAMLIKTEVLTDRRGVVGGPAAMPPEVQEIIDTLKNNLTSSQIKKYDHYLGDLPDETSTFYEENQQGKPYFLMPKRGTEDMYWCYRARRKGVEIWCDTDMFAPHLGFAPVITKGFRVKSEEDRYQLNGNGSKREVQLTELQDDNGAIRRPVLQQSKVGNLV